MSATAEPSTTAALRKRLIAQTVISVASALPIGTLPGRRADPQPLQVQGLQAGLMSRAAATSFPHAYHERAEAHELPSELVIASSKGSEQLIVLKFLASVNGATAQGIRLSRGESWSMFLRVRQDAGSVNTHSMNRVAEIQETG
ncbi:hypothetical protein BU16DRAFT_565245 [Lophium mytilinum]|uniref:Uncharacterized protein n=1 Tax=Lophium mytilinum TaxID=390894 RepID=A0A6A6QHN2_9PEZI|nr:hypothetical protein BU16DRAFT_565245 [Lophium mytilinum]